MPGISCGGSQQRNLEGAAGAPPVSCRWSVPIDDTHTLIIRLVFKPADNPGRFTKDPIAVAWKSLEIEPYNEYKQQSGDEPVTLGYTMSRVIAAQDATIIGSLGPIVDRENENSSPQTDYGILALRSMYLKEVEKVRQGEDPKGTVKDKEKNRLIVIPAYEYSISEEQYRQMKA